MNTPCYFDISLCFQIPRKYFIPESLWVKSAVKFGYKDLLYIRFNTLSLNLKDTSTNNIMLHLRMFRDC